MAKLRDRPDDENGFLTMKEEKGYLSNKLQEFPLQMMESPDSTG